MEPLSARSARVSKTHFWLLAAGILLLDQASKWVVVHAMSLYQSIPLLGEYVRLTYVRNTGAAFSLLAHPAAAPWRLYFFITTAVVTVTVLIIMVYREKRTPWYFRLQLGLISGGALGNLTDRVFRSGQVVDFIECSVKSFHWPVFNLADSAVVVGVSWIVLTTFLQTSRPAVPETKGNQAA